jgi:flavin reductase (DIM6/NTAB) family NADH-FMN oxidoreductase RutF
MFYATAERDRAKLPHDPFKAIVAPRPIGWISTRALDGRINLAPYSFFNGFSRAPPIVGFSSEGWKDSASFAKESGEFVANLATHDLQGAMNETSAPFDRGDNEFARAGLTMAECRLVAAPRVAESPAALECKVVEVVEIRTLSGTLSGAVLTLGEVVASISMNVLLLPAVSIPPAHTRSPAAATRITRRSRKSSRWLARKAAAISDRARGARNCRESSRKGKFLQRDLPILRAPQVGPERARAVRRMKPRLLFS